MQQSSFFVLKKPELKNFVKHSSARAGMWSIIQGFTAEHSRKSRIDMIEDYATGGDGGVTQDVVRLATDLPAQQSEKDENSIPAEFNVKESHDADLQKMSLSLAVAALNDQEV